MSRPPDLVQGTLEALIMSVLASEPLHGLAISKRLHHRSSEVLRASRGSLYPALHKLEHQGLLRAEWRTSESGRRAKYYSLTRRGKKRLEAETQQWERLAAAVSMVLRPGMKRGS